MFDETMSRRLIAEQIVYYRARAREYDEALRRLNRYLSLGGRVDGPSPADEGAKDTARVLEALGRIRPLGDVLELACGTGWWTQWLAQQAPSVTAVDAAPEMLALNRLRVGADNVSYVEADLFAWRPNRRYDLVFFAFWLSHVPRGHFQAFWKLVRDALAPGGRFFFVDELDSDAAQAFETRLGDDVVIRTLEDGSKFRAVKIYHTPADLQQRLGKMGLKGVEVRSCGRFFYCGQGLGG
jgi:SAM-dependent methyltransferase